MYLSRFLSQFSEDVKFICSYSYGDCPPRRVSLYHMARIISRLPGPVLVASLIDVMLVVWIFLFHWNPGHNSSTAFDLLGLGLTAALMIGITFAGVSAMDSRFIANANNIVGALGYWYHHERSASRGGSDGSGGSGGGKKPSRLRRVLSDLRAIVDYKRGEHIRKSESLFKTARWVRLNAHATYQVVSSAAALALVGSFWCGFAPFVPWMKLSVQEETWLSASIMLSCYAVLAVAIFLADYIRANDYHFVENAVLIERELETTHSQERDDDPNANNLVIKREQGNRLLNFFGGGWSCDGGGWSFASQTS